MPQKQRTILSLYLRGLQNPQALACAPYNAVCWLTLVSLSSPHMVKSKTCTVAHSLLKVWYTCWLENPTRLETGVVWPGITSHQSVIAPRT